jgi:hypothetical protein
MATLKDVQQNRAAIMEAADTPKQEEVVDLADEPGRRVRTDLDTVKYPNVTVRLVGQDGNAFNILGLVARAMRKAKVPADKIAEYQAEAMSGDYDALLATTMRWVNVE